MKAPDKIYINGDAASDLVYLPGEDDSKEEYIRKDALLEWAKSQKARLRQGYKHEWKNSHIIYGGTLALDNLIEKINSL